MKELFNILLGVILLSLILLFVALAAEHYAHGATFAPYKYTELNELSKNGDKHNGEEVQIKGKVLRIDQLYGVYGGQYLAVVLGDIIVYVYNAELHGNINAGDTVLVDGTFHVYGLFGGTGHDYYIATHHIERVN
jgi:hypothetical protein